MLIVGVEAGGSAQQCMVCPLDRTVPHRELFVIAWENKLPFLTRAVTTRTGGVLRLCHEHLDELAILIAEVL